MQVEQSFTKSFYYTFHNHYIYPEIGLSIEDIPKVEKLKKVNINAFDLDGKGFSSAAFLLFHSSKEIPEKDDEVKRIADFLLYKNLFCFFFKNTHTYDLLIVIVHVKIVYLLFQQLKNLKTNKYFVLSMSYVM